MKAGSAKATASKAAKKPAAKTTAAKKPAAKASAAKPRAAKASPAKASQTTKPAAAKVSKPKGAKAVATKAVATKAVATKAAKPKPAVARTRKATAPVLVQARSAGSATLDIILAKIDDMKAEHTVTIDLRGKSAFSDFMVVTSGRSNRHVGAVAETIAKGLKEKGIKGLHVEGLTNCDWVLIDTGEVIVHIFRPEVREFYNLERLWTQTPDTQAAIATPA
ncbi:MAG: Iojap-related protein [Tardiphaga sp.]|nr:Iojap-related protein [Tardiphaga sp.]